MTISYHYFNMRDPRKNINYFDSCAFNPQVAELEASRKILGLYASGIIIVAVTESVRIELARSRTPAEVHGSASGMFVAFAPSLTPAEEQTRAEVHRIMTGNAASPEKHASDAEHVFEAGRRKGYFITAEHRIYIHKRDELQTASGAMIVSPTQWMEIYNKHVLAMPNPC